MSDHDVLFAISSSGASASSSNSTTAAAATAPSHGGSSSSSSKSHHKHHSHHHHHHHHKFHGKTMAPTPDNDQGSNGSANPNNKAAPPDKAAKGNRGEAPKDEKVSVPRTVDDLNDGELRALLDEAANYKNPKDREGKSKLFNHLLMEAEETERNARASRAGGSELVRYHNPSAARRGGTRHRNKKRTSVSENMMHGGSLDNLAKETLYETSKLRIGKKSVSARQREGGSLPCNVNAPNAIKVECVEFLEEEARRRKIRNEPTTQQEAVVVAMPTKNEHHKSGGAGASYVMNMEPERFTFINQHDVTDKQQQQMMNSINQMSSSSSTTMPIEIVHYPVAQHAKFTSMASLHVILPVSPDGGNGNGSGGSRNNNNNNNNVDDPIQLGPLELPARAKTNHSSSNNNNSTVATITTLDEIEELKKVDENDNEKDNKEGEEGGEDGKDPDKAKEEADKKKEKDKEKKKKTGERNVTVCKSQELKGYNPTVASSSVKSILKFVGERFDIPDKELRLNPPSKSSKLKTFGDDSSGKKGIKKRNKDHTNSNAGDKLKKSNSMGEISSADFEDVIVLRNKSVDRRERRSWSEMESPMPSLIQQKQPEQQQQQNVPTENSEASEFQVVKKKNRKRRSSLGTSGIDSSGGYSSGGGHHHHHQHPHGHHHHRDYSGRKSSEDGHSYSQSGSSYAASSVSECGSGLKSGGGKPKAARSAPQSDKSDSCSDADSVHSLPISAVAPSAHEISKAAAAANAGAEAATKAKVLSYADMARNGDASFRTKQQPQQRTSFGTKIMTNYAGGGVVVVDNNANSVYNNSIDNISNNSKVQSKVERRKSPEPSSQGDENDEDNKQKVVEKQQQQQQEEKQEPPDVTSIKSFPAIKSPLEKNHGQLSVSNFSNGSNKGKTQKIDASTNTGQTTTTNAWNNRGYAASAATTPNSSSGTGGALAGFENVSGSYAVYNKLPPDIPDVQSIEKMQLLSQGHPYEESNSTISTANTTPIPSITSNVSGTGAGSAIITSTPKTGTATNDCSLDCDISEKRTNNINNNNKIVIAAAVGGDINALSSVRDDDNSSSRHYEDMNLCINESGLEEYEIVGGGEEEEYDMSQEDAAAEEETHRLQLAERQQQQQRPPVVILSGGEPKEVSGLVFGFDINEQLLNEGRSLTVEEFSARFLMPTNYTRTSHNHDDIVNFIADGWKNFSATNNVEEYSPDKM